MISKIK